MPAETGGEAGDGGGVAVEGAGDLAMCGAGTESGGGEREQRRALGVIGAGEGLGSGVFVLWSLLWGS